MKIVKKIVKWVLRAALSLAGLLLFLVFLAYLPPVQDFLIRKATGYVSEQMALDLEIERLRLRFPLSLEVDNTALRTTEGDTLLSAGMLRARVGVLPLLAGKVEVRRLVLLDAHVGFDGETSDAMAFAATVGRLELDGVRAKLSERSVSATRVLLRDATVGLMLGAAQDTTATTDTIPWHIEAGRLDLRRVAFDMSMQDSRLAVTLGNGRIDGVDARLAEQAVDVRRIRLSDGDINFTTDGTAATPASAPVSAPPVDSLTPVSPFWTIRAGSVEVARTAAEYSSGAPGVAKEGFDPSHIRVDRLSLRIDSVYNRGGDMSATLRSLSLKERSGIEITKGEGRFAADSSGLLLSGLDLRTAASTVQADVRANLHSADAPLAAKFGASLAGSDVVMLFPQAAAARPQLRGETLTVEGDITGTASEIVIRTLRADMPPDIAFSASGELRAPAGGQLTTVGDLSGSLRLDGDFRNMAFVKALLPESVRTWVELPRRMTFAADLTARRGAYDAALRITADGGALDLDGTLDVRTESYRAHIVAREFPLQSFLAADSLGAASFTLAADGRGFDPRATTTRTDIDIKVAHLEYRRYDYRDVEIAAALADNTLAGTLRSASDALRFDLAVGGSMRANGAWNAQVKGLVAEADLRQMHLSELPLAFSGKIDASASAGGIPMAARTARLERTGYATRAPGEERIDEERTGEERTGEERTGERARTEGTSGERTYGLDVTLDSVRLVHGENTDYVTRTTIAAAADLRSVVARVRAGDFALDFNSPVSLGTLTDGFSAVSGMLASQIRERDVDFQHVEEVMPAFDLDVQIGRNNPVHSVIKDRGYDFRKASITSHNNDTTAFRFRGLVENFRTAGGLALDTLNFGLGQRNERLTYFVRLANRPGNIEQLALIYLYGTIGGDSISANINQRNRDGQRGFVFGLAAHIGEDAVRAGFIADTMTFAYDTWRANPDNYFEYRFDGEMYADVALENLSRTGNYLRITSADYPALGGGGAVRLDIAGLEVGKALDLLPAPPPVDGVLTTDIVLGMRHALLVLDGTAAITNLSYDRRRVGDMKLLSKVQAGEQGVWDIDMELDVDGKKALAARGTFDTGDGAIALALDAEEFPLTVCNAFLPPDMVSLLGALNGRLQLTGTSAAPVIDGSLRFDNGQMAIPITGTAFSISDGAVRISRSRIRLRDFGLVAPNRQLLGADGTVDMTDIRRITADVSISARDFQAVNAPRNRGSQIYGLVVVNADMTARGPLAELVLRGNLRVLRTTDVVYTMRESPLAVGSVRQNIVTFTSFDYAEEMGADDTPQLARTGGVDILLNVDLDDDVQATVNLTESGSDRVELTGSGRLAYSMNTQGDVRLTGRYDISDGTVVYSPPIPMISQKVFAIEGDSYVQWTGEMANPQFNIQAVETVRTNVVHTDGQRENVRFEVLIRISGTLDSPAITFDVDAPDSFAVRDELTMMTAEDRNQQAIALLLYGVYTGPSTTTSRGGLDPNSMLASFIEREINQWARNALSGIDVSFGIRTEDDMQTGIHNQYSYQVSKSLWNDRLRVSVGGSVSDGPAAAQQNMADNLLEDVSLEYRITQRDNMFIRGYRHTMMDILEGRIVETGGGFLLRRRMERLSELFRLLPPPEVRAVRTERRQYRDSLRIEERAAQRDTAHRILTPEDSLRRAAWRARRGLDTETEGGVHDSVGERNVIPRDPGRFDRIPARDTIPARNGDAVLRRNDDIIRDDDE